MKYIFQTTKGFRLKFFILFLTIIFSTITGALFPYAIGEIVDRIFYEREMKGFLLWFFIYAGLYLLNQGLHGGLNYVWANLQVTYVVSIRKQCFRHLLKLQASVLTRIQSGDVMRRIMDDTKCFLEFIHRSLFYIFANFIQLAISIGYLLYTSTSLGIIAIIMTPIMAYSIRYFTFKLKEKHQEISRQKGFVEAWILEMMNGIQEWKLLNAAGKVRKDYHEKTNLIINEEKKSGYISIASESINEALTLLGQLCIYCVAAAGIGKGTMTVGQFVACAAYFSTCASYYNALGKKITDVSGNLVGIRRVEEFLQWEEEKDSEGARELEVSTGSIRFENVSFGYDEKPVLKNMSLKIEAGDKIAFVGKSGEGKSTLLQLLYRLYELDEGRIYVDNKCLKEYTISSLREQIAVVQQDNGLFHGSIRKNIILSDDKSADERIWQILDGLCLREVVEELPEGLDTLIGSGERDFSGGQKQRFAIARCIYRNPKILLLDEATSALDARIEALVNTYIMQELPETTILSVAHRFSTVLASKKAVVIEQGQVTAVGPHDELIRNNAMYQTLYTEYENSLRKREAGGGNE